MTDGGGVTGAPTRSGPLLDGFRMAVGTFTAVPTRPPGKVDAPVARAALLLAPVAMIPIGLFVGGLCWGATTLGLTRIVTAILAVGALALGNRAFHLDGLADTADGFAASYDRQRALDVMKVGNIGPAGTVTLVLILAVQVTALPSLLARPWGPLVAGVAICLSRAWVLIGCTSGVPAARPGGLGAAVAGSVPWWITAAVLTLSAAVLGLAGGRSDLPLWQGVLGAAVATVAVGVLILRARKRFGGITGDVLGACVEIALSALFVVFAAG